MQSVFQFLASQAGRALRGVAGLALILIGVILGGTAGIILIIVGVVPLAAGVFDFCVFAPLFGMAFQGKDLRKPYSDEVTGRE